MHPQCTLPLALTFFSPSFFHTISLSPAFPTRARTHTHTMMIRIPISSNLVREGQTSPHRLRLVVSRSACPPLSPSPHANSFVIGTAVANTHTINFLNTLVGLDTHSGWGCGPPGGLGLGSPELRRRNLWHWHDHLRSLGERLGLGA